MGKGEKLTHTSDRPRKYWPPESRAFDAKYDGSTIDMYQSGILLCRILSPEANLLFSKNTPPDKYLYNKQEFQPKMNELQLSIEKLNKTISNKEKQGCET